MNNTLSKPVAWKLHHHDRYYFEENADVVAIAESMGQAKGDAVYSQEYVSALRADAAKWFEAFQKAVSIGARYEERIAELEAKLATPVRLPDTRQSVSGDRYQWSDGVFNYKQDAIALLREQGFIIEGGE